MKTKITPKFTSFVSFTLLLVGLFSFSGISHAQYFDPMTGQPINSAYTPTYPVYNPGTGLNTVAPTYYTQPQTYFDPQTGLNIVNPSSNSCLVLSYNLRSGMRDWGAGDITRYQSFLISNGYLGSGLATGYFGKMTTAATVRFQVAHGLSATGSADLQTRTRIQTLTCRTVPPPVIPPVTNLYAPTISSISPSSGPFGTVVTIYGQNFSPTSNSINFANVSNIAYNVPSINGTSIQFTIPYGPCAQGNQVCTAIAFAPGQFPLSVTTSAGTSNSVVFNATNNYPNNYNQAPVVSGVDGPVNLSVGQQGNWSVRAYSPTYSGEALSYSVVWGDESQYNNSYYSYPNSGSGATQQSASFTHVYNNPGTYRPTFTVRGSNGQTAQTSLTVVVGSGGNQYGAPVIYSISPAFGPVGTVVTVQGSNFSRFDNYVNFAGVNRAVSAVQSYDGTSLQFTIPGTPCGSGSYCAQVILQPGQYPVSVSNQYGTSGSVNFALTNSSGGGTGTINQSTTLSLNQTGYINNTNLEILPLSVTEDNRCPIGVTCIQAGNVVVQTQIRTGTVNTYVRLSSNLNDRYITPEGYIIEITQVTPVRYQGQTISNADYRITYRVTR